MAMQEQPETVKQGTTKTSEPSTLASEEYRALLRRAQQCRRGDGEETADAGEGGPTNGVGVPVGHLQEAERHFEMGQQRRMRWDLVWQVAVVLLVLAAGIKFYVTWQGMQNSLTTVMQTKGTLLVVLQRRHKLASDLLALPELGEAETAAANQRLATAASAVSTGDPASQAQGLDLTNRVLRQALQQCEQQPSVRSSGIFKTLRKQVWDSDEVLSEYRRVYNNSVKHYNGEATGFIAGLCRRAFRWPDHLVYFRSGG